MGYGSFSVRRISYALCMASRARNLGQGLEDTFGQRQSTLGCGISKPAVRVLVIGLGIAYSFERPYEQLCLAISIIFMKTACQQKVVDSKVPENHGFILVLTIKFLKSLFAPGKSAA